jgi:hypothetical protein
MADLFELLSLNSAFVDAASPFATAVSMHSKL